MTEPKLDSIYCGNCAEVMATWPDECIDLTVTSPPYDNLRSYDGYVFDFEAIAKQLYRITKKGGVVVWIVGDETRDFCETMSSFKHAIYFVEICGFNLLDTMIYRKLNYAPAYPTLRRYSSVFEYMFVFSKGRPNTFSPILRDKKTDSTILRNKYGGRRFAKRDGTYSIKKHKIETTSEFKQLTNVWDLSVGAEKPGHPAPFPEQLASDHIVSWSNLGDVVLDPMCGSGTTLKMAKELGRRWIGIDTSQKYCDISQKRVDGARVPLFSFG